MDPYWQQLQRTKPNFGQGVQMLSIFLAMTKKTMARHDYQFEEVLTAKTASRRTDA
jgi:hypothetical protein